MAAAIEYIHFLAHDGNDLFKSLSTDFGTSDSDVVREIPRQLVIVEKVDRLWEMGYKSGVAGGIILFCHFS